MLIGDILTRAAKWFPEKEAVVFEGTRLTYKEFNDRTNRLAHALLEMGVKKDERVAVVCHNSNHYGEILFALAKIGAVSTNLNWRLSPKELAFLIDDSEANIVLFSKRFEHLYGPTKEQIPKKLKYIAVDGKIDEEMIDYEELIAKYPADEPLVEVSMDDTFLQLYTSGTTGRPKGVMLTHKNMMANAVSTIIEMEMTRDMNVLGLLPIFHIAIFVLINLVLIGGKVTFIHSFDIPTVLKTMQDEKITAVGFTPVIFKFLLDHPDIDKYDLSSLRQVIYATAPMPVDLLRRSLEKFKCDFIQFFGMTEMSPTLTMLIPDDHVLDGPEHKVKWLGSAGRPISNVEVRIIDEKGNDCPPGVTGEIIGRGDNVMKGYHKMVDATAEAIRDGWYYTGDMGYFDEYGYLFIADRKKDMIISGGENIYPREVEEAILLLEGVFEVAVIGVPDDEWGESVKAILVKTPGAEITEEDVISHCKANIASYKKPKSVDFVDMLPRSALGKVLKHELRAPFWEGRDRKV
ncbi:MAG: long-chain-fatty-acid--CoA ligase [Deltaproteobacteria bacterium]|uniref:Long-chain-fatty-acid--CoA ligase n=1 Tax=Candidatus Zymogenus saltonus TaxID=2844893 RepID=A0A9D8KG94_9DELT|nr:long-chain-fatty-acid--CoA ligase [Candidatus Zymogenus saltonus]